MPHRFSGGGDHRRVPHRFSGYAIIREPAQGPARDGAERSATRAGSASVVADGNRSAWPVLATQHGTPMLNPPVFRRPTVCRDNRLTSLKSSARSRRSETRTPRRPWSPPPSSTLHPLSFSLGGLAACPCHDPDVVGGCSRIRYTQFCHLAGGGVSGLNGPSEGYTPEFRFWSVDYQIHAHFSDSRHRLIPDGDGPSLDSSVRVVRIAAAFW